MRNKIIALLASVLFAGVANAQIINPKETTKRKVEDRTNTRADQTIDKGLDKVEEGIGNIFKKKDKKQKENTTSNPTNNSNSGDGNTNGNDHSTKSNSRFDFEQGNKVLYFDDFHRLNLGDFPAEFNTNSSGEVVNASGKNGKWLAMTKNGAFIPESIKTLPENFTLEFEIGIIGDPSNNMGGFGINFTTVTEELMKDMFFGQGTSVVWIHPSGNVANIGIFPSSGTTPIENEIKMTQWNVGKKNFAKISIWRQKGRLRLYVNQDKIIDVPRFFAESKPYQLAFFRSFFDECELLVTNIRFAVAGEDTRNKLITDGKFVTTGILFDVNSDHIKPESGAVLKEIATVLQENPTIKIKIIGHTDSDGDANANLILSHKRALSVKAAFVNFYGINAGRMETEGKGESQPVNSNSNIEGKTQNRRVEFVRL